MKEKKGQIAGLSILANITLAGGKIAVGLFSNSAAILAGGIDSLVDIFSSTIGFIGIKIAKKPADEKHPYGHHKFEVLTGMIITAIVFATGLGIIYNAWQNFFNPENVKISYLTFSVMIFSVIVNEIMSRLKIHYGKKEGSVSLLSDGVHSKIDVYTSLAILAGLFLNNYWIYTDPILAFLVGLFIIKESISLGKESIDSLLDVSAGPEVGEKIKEIAKKQNIEIASLKTQKKGAALTANLEINLPSNLNVDQATKISNTLKEKLIENVEFLEYVAIQIASHQIETNFYKHGIGKGFGWQRKGKFKEKIEEATGQGPGGFCVCSKCDYQIKHEKGTPCSSLKCPTCDINLKRK